MTKLTKMVVFDLDGVLTDVDSSWQTVHRAFGVDNEENFQKHLRGEIDYKEFMRSDISLWGRAHISRIKSILDQVPLMKGARETLERLRKEGLKTAIISSGISMLAERVKGELGIDFVFANRLLTDEGGFLLRDGEEVVTLRNKGVVLEKLCREEDIRPEDCAVVGDSGFDVSLFEKAGLNIAFNAKDTLIREAADVIIDTRDLTDILHWIVSGKGARADVSFSYETEEKAEIIVRTLYPDNLKVPPGLAVRTYRRRSEVKTRVYCVKGFGTLLTTLDDLLLNIQLVEKTIRTLETLA